MRGIISLIPLYYNSFIYEGYLILPGKADWSFAIARSVARGMPKASLYLVWPALSMARAELPQTKSP